ncbi:MAG TPA: 2-octaprenyl-6-methoxyphenyl hydroxylase [Woeseiaceae bacterium]|nr:2-octaprenyl-6-methoxyphenyl hydroxylase [Woeseiaceae bacterium]
MSTAAAVDFDVVIAGGGMVGATAALAFAPLGLRIAVVEAAARNAAVQPSFDERSTALSRSSERLYGALGLWDRIEPGSAPIRHIHVSDQGRFGFSHIDADEQGVDVLGRVVINRVLGDVLTVALAAVPNVTGFCPARVTAVHAEPGGVTVRIETGEGGADEVRTHLLVAADGAHSSVRDLLGIPAEHRAYAQQAVVGNLETAVPIRDTAYERFTRAGPLALLPVPGGRAAFVWTVADADAARVLALDDAAFAAELNAAFGMRLGRFDRIGRRAGYALSLNRARRVTATRSVLIGNAAHGLHPVAAQGFNLGLRDVAALADCVADALAAGGDTAASGDARVLDRYAAWRRADQRKLVAFTDGLVRLFGSDRAPVRAVRDLGMLAFDLVPGVRREFARHTMGLAGHLPRLARGVPLR